MHRIPVCGDCLLNCGMISLFFSESHDTQLEHYTEAYNEVRKKISKAEFTFQYLLQINLIRTAPLLFGGDVYNDRKMSWFLYKVVVKSSTSKVLFFTVCATVEANLFVEMVKMKNICF